MFNIAPRLDNPIRQGAVVTNQSSQRSWSDVVVNENLVYKGVEQLPRVVEVDFGVGAGACQTLEGLVQNRNDPPLFFERREGD